MKHLYEYVSPEQSGHQYDDYNLRDNKIVDARYTETGVYQNPYIEALPFAKTSQEVVETINNVPSLPSREEFFKKPEPIRDMILDTIKQYKIALSFNAELEKEFARVLRESYAMRCDQPAEFEVSVKGVPFQAQSKLDAYHPGEAVPGFAMLGVAGCGKSTAMNMVFDHYPQVIIHHWKDPEETRVQIVYLFVTCSPKSNFRALYVSIGKAIDAALKNRNTVYEDTIRRAGNLGQMAQKIEELIEKFAIGIIVFDEIQNINMNYTSENSIEALLKINNNTHVGMGVLGTEEAFKGLFTRDRTARRFESYISAGRYCTDMEQFTTIIQGLFLSNLFEKTPVVDDEIINAFLTESDGVITYVIQLYYYINADYVSCAKPPVINAEYIKKISSQKSKIIHDLIYRNHQKTIPAAERKRLIDKMNDYGYDDAKKQQDSDFTKKTRTTGIMFKKGDAVEAILNNYSNYKKENVENAVEVAMRGGCSEVDDIIEAALKHLESQKSDRNKKTSKTEKYEKIKISDDEILESITENMKGLS